MYFTRTLHCALQVRLARSAMPPSDDFPCRCPQSFFSSVLFFCWQKAIKGVTDAKHGIILCMLGLLPWQRHVEKLYSLSPEGRQAGDLLANRCKFALCAPHMCRMAIPLTCLCCTQVHGTVLQANKRVHTRQKDGL